MEEYLKNKLQNKDKNVTLVESKKAQNEKDRTQSEEISNVVLLGQFSNHFLEDLRKLAAENDDY